MGRALILIIIAGTAGWLAGARYPSSADWVFELAGSATEGNFAEGVSGLVGGITGVDEDTSAEDEESASDAADDEVEAQDNSGSSASGEQTLDQYRAWIREARASYPYPESEERMYAVMMCESGGRATVVNPAGPYSGLFQYSPATWNGDWNTYRNEDILDPRAQIFATALAWSNGMQGHWGCYSHTG